MRDYELAKHSPQDYFDYAQEKYDEAIALVKKLTFYAKKINSDFSEPIALREFDFILQCILIKEAICDGEFHRLEGQFIDKLTENGDVLLLLEHETGIDLSWDILPKLTKDNLRSVAALVEKAAEEYADDFVSEFAKIDCFDVREDYLEVLEQYITDIAACLAQVDGKVYLEEVVVANAQRNDILSKKWKLRKYSIQLMLDEE